MSTQQRHGLSRVLGSLRQRALTGSVVIAGEPDTPAVCEVIDVVEEPSGTIVNLRLLTGTIGDYEALVRRAGIPA